jgi:site-specific DNA recombinase
MLQNRIYRGEITHKGKSYPGEHPAIIDQPLWDEVQAVLTQNRVERATGARAKHPNLLGGLVFDATGERLTPTYAIKKGTRYRYYVSSSLVRAARANRASGWRLPAGDVEGLVISRLRNFFADPAAMLDIAEAEAQPGSGQRQLIERGRQVAEELRMKTPDKVKATLMVLRCRVTIHSDRIEIALSRGRTAELLAGQSIDLAAPHQGSDPASHDVMSLRMPARLKRVGREMRMLVEGADDQTAPDPSLLRVIARAHAIQGHLSQNADLSVHDIAREEGVTAAYIYTLLRLPWLAPDITSAIVSGRQPHQLNAQTLMRKVSRLPASWTEQRRLLGF